jgi:hypothetical protein
MKLSHAFVLSFLGLAFAGSASADYCINKDVVNLGPTAYDLGVLITGNQPLTGSLVHIGWCTVQPNDIVDMWWTDRSGGRVTGSVVYESWMHQSKDPRPGVQWPNRFNTGTLVISNVSVALSASAWPLEALNRDNTVLAGQLTPLPGGTSFDVPAGGTSASIPVPNASKGQWLVVKYNVSGSGSMAQTTDYAQIQLQ